MAQSGTKKLAVIGYPIKHSLSPRIHTRWLVQHNIDATYEAIEVAPDDLKSFLRSLAESGFVGINITLPYKEAALQLTDENDAVATAIGAVNTIVVKSGKLSGRNTDAYGFMENLNAGGAHVARKKALILGAGGAARAVCKGLLDTGCQLTLANRTREKADALAASLSSKIRVSDWQDLEQEIAATELLVNTTSLGMKGQPSLTIPLATLPKRAVVTDIVYNPLITPLLAEAAKRGNSVVDGLGMLLYQAQMAFYLWFGIMPAVDDALRKHVLESLQ